MIQSFTFPTYSLMLPPPGLKWSISACVVLLNFVITSSQPAKSLSKERSSSWEATRVLGSFVMSPEFAQSHPIAMAYARRCLRATVVPETV